MEVQKSHHSSSATTERLIYRKLDFGSNAFEGSPLEFRKGTHLSNFSPWKSSLTAYKRVPAMLLRTSIANGPFTMRLSLFYSSNLWGEKQVKPKILDQKERVKWILYKFEYSRLRRLCVNSRHFFRNKRDSKCC